MVRRTSAEVYRLLEASGILSARRWEAYRIFYEHGPLTANEAHRYAAALGNQSYRHNMSARCNELREWGALYEVGTKVCSVTGFRAILWDVTDQMPVKPTGKKEGGPVDPVRFLVVGDQHVDVTGPLRRRDKYLDTVWRKLAEVKNIAREYDIKLVVWTGDLFDRTDQKVPHWLVNQLIDYFRSFEDGTEHLLALGNHDIKGNVESWHRQPIGSIVRSGAVVPLWEEPHAVGDTLFTSVPYREDADEPGQVAATYGVDRSYPRHIHVVHTTLLPDTMSLPIPHTTPLRIASAVPEERRADLYVGGHIHDDLGGLFGTPQNDVLCVNFGSLTRLTVGASDRARKVSVGLVEIGDEWRVRAIPLECALPAGEVFDFFGLEEERRDLAELEQLAESFGQAYLADQFRLVDPVEAVELALQRQDLADPVKDRVRALIQQAKEAVT